MFLYLCFSFEIHVFISLHIKNSISHNALQTERQSTRLCCFLSVSVSYVFISVLSTCHQKLIRVSVPFWWSHAALLLFVLFYKMEGPSSSSGTQTKCQCGEKKGKKVSFSLFIETENTDTERSGQRIKSLFFILYIWKCKTPVCCIALLYKSNVLVAFF